MPTPPARPVTGTFWPFRPRMTIAAKPLLLLLLIAVLVGVRAAFSWPDQDSTGWAMLAIVLLSITPVLMVFLDGMARQGGVLEWRSVRLSFSGTAAPAGSLVPANATLPGTPVLDSAMDSVLRTAQAAAHDRILVVDLGTGQAWWESRLLMLCAVAADRSPSGAVVLVADRAGRSGCFLGWAHPNALRDRLLEARPQLRLAYNSAAMDSLRHAAGTPPTPPLQTTDELTPLVRPSGRHLALHIGRIEAAGPDPLSAASATDLFDPILVTTSIDRRNEPEWIAQALATNAAYLGGHRRGTPQPRRRRQLDPDQPHHGRHLMTGGQGAVDTKRPGQMMLLWWSWAGGAAVLLVGGVGVGTSVRGHWGGVLVDTRGRYSLTRGQISLWTVAILPLIAAVLIARSTENGTDPLGFTVPTEVLDVLGVSVGSAAAATAVRARKNRTRTPFVAASPDGGARLVQAVLVEEGAALDLAGKAAVPSYNIPGWDPYGGAMFRHILRTSNLGLHSNASAYNIKLAHPLSGPSRLSSQGAPPHAKDTC